MSGRTSERSEGLWDAFADAVVFVLVLCLCLWIARHYQHVAIAVMLALMLWGRRT